MTEQPQPPKETSKDALKDLKRKVKDISTRINIISGIKAKLDKHYDKIHELNDVIRLEREIKTYPNNANGSVVLYNKLNEHYDSFSEDHFNKIVRFISLIEVEEKRYRNNYLMLTQKYSHPVDAKPYQVTALNSIGLLNRFYSLLDILITEVNGDKVKYSKVYNFLEDQGFFMTRIEKESIELLQQINNNIDNVFKGIVHLIESQKETNTLLETMSSEISSALIDVNANLYGVEQNLWSIYMDQE